MSEKNFLLALRAAMARKVESAPRQHHLRTPDCPPLTRFVPGAHWTEHEQAHMAGCSYCRMILGMVGEKLSASVDPETSLNDVMFTEPETRFSEPPTAVEGAGGQAEEPKQAAKPLPDTPAPTSAPRQASKAHDDQPV